MSLRSEVLSFVSWTQNTSAPCIASSARSCGAQAVVPLPPQPLLLAPLAPPRGPLRRISSWQVFQPATFQEIRCSGALLLAPPLLDEADIVPQRLTDSDRLS